MSHGNQKHSRTHLEVAGDRSGNDRHLTYQQEVASRLAGKHSHTNDASENGKDTTIHSEALNGNGRNTQWESHVDRYDENGKSKNSKGRLEDIEISQVTDEARFGSAEIYDALYPTEKLETSSSLSSSSSEDLFQVDTKKVLTSKASTTSVPKSTEVTRQTANHDDLDKESDVHHKLSSPTSFEFRHGSSMHKMLPTESLPIQTMNRSRGPDRNGSQPSIFNRSHSMLDWSVASNDSLFSINVGNHSFDRDDDLTMRRSEEITKSPEVIVYVPSPLIDKKENCERAKVDIKNEKLSAKEVLSDKKAADLKVASNSSNDTDESGGNAESFAYAVNKKPTSRSCFNCGWGFCYCSCFSCFTCCTSCSWPSGYCCKVSCSCCKVSCSCCKIWNCTCQRWCGCSPKCLTKGDDKSVSSPDAEKEQVKANPAEEKEKSSESWFSCFSCAPIRSCLSCSPSRSCLSCSPSRSCLSCFSCPSSKSCFSCFSCSFLQSCFSCFSPCRWRLPSCQCFSCSGCYFPSCQGCCTLPSCGCFSCSGCCSLPSCRCFSCSGCCSLPNCGCFSCLRFRFPSYV